jgi:predicted DNA-binding antitoxin AbrB/MazE fold protein
MLNAIEAIVKNGQIVPLEDVELEEGSRAIVTILDNETEDFWVSASDDSANRIWDTDEDDVYAELLS